MEKENKIVKGVSIELSKRCLLFSLHEYSARSDHIVRRSEHPSRSSGHLQESFRRMKSGSNSVPNSTKGGRLCIMA